MSQATNNTTKWTIPVDLGTVGGSNVSKTLTIETSGTYVDKNIEVTVSAAASSAAKLGASGTGSATVSSVTVGSKTGNTYAVSGSADISGTASAVTSSSGFATKGTTTGTGSVTGTATVDATIPAGALNASGTASATIGSVSFGTKSGTNYPVSGSGTISGTASAGVATAGYVKNETGTGTVTGTATLSGVTVPAIKLGASGTGSATISTASVSKVGSEYHITGSADITGSATASVTTAGYGKAGAETGTGSVTGTATLDAKIDSANITPSASDPGTSYEKKTVTLASDGYLKIDAGYIPNTKISLADLVPDGADIPASTSSPYILTGHTAYDNDGKLITGGIANGLITNNTSGGTSSGTIDRGKQIKIGAGYYPSDVYYQAQSNSGTVTITQQTGQSVDGYAKADVRAGSATVNGSATAEISTPAYDSTSGKFTQLASGTGSASVTVSTAGWISSIADGAVSIDGSKSLDVIGGSVSISGTKTVTPVVSTTSVPSGVTNAADSVPTSAPSSGVYVAVKSDAKTTNVQAAATISTAGYGTSANNNISGSGNVAVGANASTTTYVKIKEGAAAVSSAIFTVTANGSPTLQSKRWRIPVWGSTDITGTVSTEGWITSISSATVIGSGTISLNAATLNHFSTATVETSPKITVSTAATGVATATSGSYYITVSTAATEGSIKHAASVTEGYTQALTSTATISVAPTANGNIGRVYLATTSLTNSVTASTAGAITGYSAPVTVDADSSVPQVKLTGSGSGTTGRVLTSTGTAADKYINYYTGTYQLV